MFDPSHDCGACRNHFESFKKETCPCDVMECPFGKPSLYLSNILAWELYQKVSGQVIVAGMGDVLGIKFDAIEFVFNIYCIDDRDARLDLFEKILTIDSVRMKRRSEQIITQMNAKKSESRSK